MTTIVDRIEGGPTAPVIVIFGGNPHRRQEVLALLRRVGGVTAIGALSEAEGMTLLRELPRVDLVLIGGRYGEAERARIRAWLRSHLPATHLTEPGVDYPYSDAAIVTAVQAKLGLPRA